MAEVRLPRSAKSAAMAALERMGASSSALAVAVEEILTAALPAIERAVQRDMARRILALDEADRELGSRGKGPYNDMRTSLRRLARGEALPDLPEEGGDG